MLIGIFLYGIIVRLKLLLQNVLVVFGKLLRFINKLVASADIKLGNALAVLLRNRRVVCLE